MRRAVSLAELLVTLAMVSVILTVLSSMFAHASRSIVQSRLRVSALESAVGGFTQIRQDLASAILIYSPAPGTTTNTISLLRMNPYSTSLTLPPHSQANQWLVSYQIQGTTLVRTVKPVKPISATPWNSTVANNLHAFNCTISLDSKSIPYCALLQATVPGTERSQPVSLEVPLHLPVKVADQ